MEHLDTPTQVDVLNYLPDLPTLLLGLVALTFLGVFYSFLTRQRPYAGFPVATLEEKGFKAWLLPKLSWMLHPSETRAKGHELSKGSKIYQIATGAGYRIVLPREFAEELRNHKDLDFSESGRRDFHAQRVLRHWLVCSYGMCANIIAAWL